MSYENYIFEKIKTLENNIVDEVSVLLKDQSTKIKLLKPENLTFINSFILRYVESFIEKDSKKAKELSNNIYVNVCKRVFYHSKEINPIVFVFLSQKVKYNSLVAFYLPKVVIYNFKYLNLIQRTIMKN